MIKILAIGNSFSQDATAYLYDMAKAAGKEMKVVNLYIGGCSLKTHWSNIEADAPNYEYELNGQYNGRKSSVKEALQEEAWDYVTLQQVSGESGILETYDPYLDRISEYVKQFAPAAEQLLHQTWAYELDSEHSDFIKYDKDQKKMYEAILRTYRTLSERLSLRVIPSGTVIQELRAKPVFDYANGGISLCRDGYHMHMIYGRYAVAATWYEFILKESILKNNFIPCKEGLGETDREVIDLVKEAVHAVVSKQYEK